MEANPTIQRLIQRPPSNRPILSVFLDMSVNSDNKRTYGIFLQQERAQFHELASDRPTHHRENIGEAFDRISGWLESAFDQANKGVALFTEIGGDWLEAVQLPVSLTNQLAISDRVVIGPLVEIFAADRHYATVLVDREHMRVMSYRLGVLQNEREMLAAAYPTPHDVQKGGTAQKEYQKYKAEEVRHFFREAAHEIAAFDRRYQPEFYVLFGTEENVRHFQEYLPAPVQERVVHTSHGSSDASHTEIVERLLPFVSQHITADREATLDLVRDRVRNQHFAIAGIRDTLEQLQEGKVDTLVIARDLNRDGAQCTRCEFLLSAHDSVCPYCGGELRPNIDLLESMVRMAAAQDVRVEFVESGRLEEMNGVAGLLRF